MVTICRKTFGHFAVNGIMFNHESSRRGENFVTRKVCRASAKRDWGYAPDYVRGMWLSLQHATAEDYIFATGKVHSVQDVVETAFATMNLDWRQHVRKDNRLLRPAEPQRLQGNPAKARRLLNWEPSVTFKQMIEDMTKAEHTLLAATP